MIEIRLDGPSRNALGVDMMTSFLSRLHDAAGQPVLVTGTDDAFSAGLLLGDVARLDDASLLDFLRLLERTMTSLYLYPGPTVALVNGDAIAGGCVLSTCCDHRVSAAKPSLRIGLNEVALATCFPPRINTIVKERVPREHHTEVLLGGALFGPRDALRVGLVDEIAEDAPSIARTRLAALASNPLAAYARIKRDLRGTEADLCADDVQERRLRASLDVWRKRR